MDRLGLPSSDRFSPRLSDSSPEATPPPSRPPSPTAVGAPHGVRRPHPPALQVQSGLPREQPQPKRQKLDAPDLVPPDSHSDQPQLEPDYSGPLGAHMTLEDANEYLRADNAQLHNTSREMNAELMAKNVVIAQTHKYLTLVLSLLVTLAHSVEQAGAERFKTLQDTVRLMQSDAAGLHEALRGIASDTLPNAVTGLILGTFAQPWAWGMGQATSPQQEYKRLHAINRQMRFVVNSLEHNSAVRDGVISTTRSHLRSQETQTTTMNRAILEATSLNTQTRVVMLQTMTRMQQAVAYMKNIVRPYVLPTGMTVTAAAAAAAHDAQDDDDEDPDGDIEMKDPDDDDEDPQQHGSSNMTHLISTESTDVD